MKAYNIFTERTVGKQSRILDTTSPIQKQQQQLIQQPTTQDQKQQHFYSLTLCAEVASLPHDVKEMLAPHPLEKDVPPVSLADLPVDVQVRHLCIHLL